MFISMESLPGLDVLFAKPWLLLLAACVALLLASRLFPRGRADGLVLPPGPPGLPVIGNLLDLPASGGDEPEFKQWHRHNELYGPVSSVRIMGQTIVVLHSRDAARQLLEKRSKSTASRPHMEFGHRMCGYSNLLSVQKFEDPSYVPRRRLVHQYLGTPAASARYRSMQQVEAGKLLQRILDSPQQLMAHLQYYSAAVVLEATYGYTLGPSSDHDLVVTLIQRMLDDVTEAFLPMARLVDAIPVLRHLPGWLPGAGFVRTARQYRQTCEESAEKPFQFVKEQMRGGRHRPSYVSNILDRDVHPDRDDDADDDADEDANVKVRQRPATEDDVKWTAATMYGGGVETSSSTLDAFVLAMVLFPEVQRRAQQEIDRVAGGRLPTFEDRARLPYTAAVLTEALRWFPVLPMGLPHVAQEDLAYGGRLVPRGAYLLTSAWWLCHDPECHADPERFDPERYLAPRCEPDPRAVIFGFGRRICPGRYFVDGSLFIAMARLLAAFSITHDVDGEGRPRPVEVKYTSSMSTRPVKFPFRIAPRSARHAELIRDLPTTV